MSDRYTASGSDEAEYQPGSDGRVLANRLGIVNPDSMDDAELAALDVLQRKLIQQVEYDQVFTATDLCHWHRDWLGDIYSWAGRYRALNLQKDGYTFAAARRIPALMEQLERNVLSTWTPCCAMDEFRLLDALALCHVEFIVIHPFREGNGRMARVLATMMALQAGWPLLDFSALAGNRREYFAAIQHGHAHNYRPIKRIFRKVLQSSRREG